MLRIKIKMLHHHHSGKLRPHEYTSYPLLGLLLIIVGIALTVSSVFALDPPPQAGSVGLTGSMPGPAPTVGAIVTSPGNGQHFSTSPITVKGTCPKTTLVEIYKNDIFAGSGACSDSGTFGFQIDLLIGSNTLVARVYDSLNQAGPDSNAINVYYDAVPSQGAAISPLGLTGAQLLLNTNAVYRGVFPGHPLSIPITILGGTPPYAVDVQWGDTTHTIIPRNDNVTFNTTHTYAEAGTYQITLQATSSQGRVAFLTVIAIVNGQPGINVALASTTTNKPENRLLVLWPLYTTATSMVLSFWLGERREKHMLGSPSLRFHAQT